MHVPALHLAPATALHLTPTAVVQLVPILGAEKSKVPFYVAGGLLVAWALIVSLGLGLRRPEFPGDLAGERVVIAISAVLVLAAVSTAVITSGPPATAGASGARGEPSTQATTGEPSPAPAASSPAAPAPVTSTRAATPKATTGTPAPASSPAAGAATGVLKLAANPSGQLSYDTKQLSAKAGKVTIDLTNASSLEHNLTIAQGSTILGATPTFTGGSRTLTVSLKPGTYTFYCSVPGHRQAGMEGTLNVS
jgi:plastocyanin